MESKKYMGPSDAWLAHTDEIEAACLSVAAAGLAAELGTVDGDVIRKNRAASEAAPETPRPTTTNG